MSGVESAVLGGGAVLDAIRGEPGGPELLELSRDRDDAAVVGGATRDLLRGQAPRELDVVVAAEAARFAEELAARIPGGGAAVTVHDRFGTAAVEWAGGRVDIAERRAESYPAPGALPEVRAGSVDEDLRRRDFTVNAIAVWLGGAQRGSPAAPEHAFEDLAAGRLRVMHERSFIDDPTRLLRLARYGARLQFEPEPITAALAAQAIAAGALATVSRTRIGAELRLALLEQEPVAALVSLRDVGVLAALEPPLGFDEDLARRALEILPEDGRREELLLAVLLQPLASGGKPAAERVIAELLDGFEFQAGERDRATRSALRARGLAARLREARRPSEVRQAVGSLPVEAVALAAALDAEASRSARAWLQELRHVRLEISGDDLLAAGMPAGPQVGRRLELALERKLDGELAEGREAELRAALEAPA